MAQLIVNVEDVSAVAALKKAIGLLRGVTDVRIQKVSASNIKTKKAMHDVEVGNTVRCSSFEEYLEKVK